MVANNIVLEFYATYPIGYSEGVFNVPRNIAALGPFVHRIDNYMVRDFRAIDSVNITPPMPQAPYFNNMPTNLLVYHPGLPNGLRHYFITGYSVDAGVISFGLELNPLFPMETLQVEGILDRAHVVGGNFRNMAVSREFEPWNETYQQATASLIPNIDSLINVIEVDTLLNGSNQAIPVLPFFATRFSSNSITGANGANFGPRKNTVIVPFNHSVTQDMLRRLNELGVNPIVSSYVLPQNSVLIDGAHATPGGTLQLSTQTNSFSVYAQLSLLNDNYTGSNEIIRSYAYFRACIAGSSQYVEFDAIHAAFGNNTVRARINFDPSPTGTSFIQIVDRGLGKTVQDGFLLDVASGQPWNRLAAVVRGQTGEAFARLQDDLRRREIEEQFSLTSDQNQLNYRQNEINRINSYRQIGHSLAQQTLGTFGSALGGDLAGTISGGLNMARSAGDLFMNADQQSLNRDTLALQERKARVQRELGIDAIAASAALRQAPATRLSNPSASNTAGRFALNYTGVLQKYVPVIGFNHFLDRWINAYGQPIEPIYVSNINARRNVHNVYKFKTVSVSRHMGNNALENAIAEEMLRKGIRVWEVVPSRAGVYNNP